MESDILFDKLADQKKLDAEVVTDLQRKEYVIPDEEASSLYGKPRTKR